MCLVVDRLIILEFLMVGSVVDAGYSFAVLQ